MTLFKRSVSSRGVAVFAGEVLLIFGSIAVALRLHERRRPRRARLWWKAAITAVLWQLCLYYNDFYDLTLVQTQPRAGRAAPPGRRRGGDRPRRRSTRSCRRSTSAAASIITALCLFLVAVLAWRLLLQPGGRRPTALESAS